MWQNLCSLCGLRASESQDLLTGSYNEMNILDREVVFSSVDVKSSSNCRANQSNAWDAWRWRKSVWLAVHDGAITLGVSLHEDMTKLISVRGRTLQLEHRLLNHL